jgi:hypothetical protein
LVSPHHPGFDWHSADHVFPQDSLDPLGGHAAADHPIGPDKQDRTLGADAQAVGFGAQHDVLGLRRILEAQLPQELLEAVPAGDPELWTGAAEDLGGGGAEQQVVAGQENQSASEIQAGA